MIVALPALIPLTNPNASTVATVVSLDDHSTTLLEALSGMMVAVS